MKIALMGATGFIGKNLLSTLDFEENEYICIVRKQSNCKNLLCCPELKIKTIDFSYENIKEALFGIDILVYMIGQMGGNGVTKDNFEKTNCELTQTVVDAALAVSITQIIYLSTPGVQGFGKRLCTENEPYAPRNVYEYTKMKAEQIIINSLQGTDTKYTILRPDFVYGPGDYRRIKMYKNIRDKKFILTTSGKSFLHPTYVMDVVQGINCTIGNKESYNQIFNISAENDITTTEYLKTIAKYFNVPLIKINIGYSLSIVLASLIEKLSKKILKKEGFVSKSKIDFLSIDHSTSIEKAKKMLGYKPLYSFESGYAETMKWCKENNLL